jgi:hypothetical protein
LSRDPTSRRTDAGTIYNQARLVQIRFHEVGDGEIHHEWSIHSSVTRLTPRTRECLRREFLSPFTDFLEVLGTDMLGATILGVPEEERHTLPSRNFLKLPTILIHIKKNLRVMLAAELETLRGVDQDGLESIKDRFFSLDSGLNTLIANSIAAGLEIVDVKEG